LEEKMFRLRGSELASFRLCRETAGQKTSQGRDLGFGFAPLIAVFAINVHIRRAFQ
jgi:hypothetical protein